MPTKTEAKKPIPTESEDVPLIESPVEKVETPEGERQAIDVSACEQLKELTAAVRLRSHGATTKTVGLTSEEKKAAAAAIGVTAEGFSGGGLKLYSPKVEPVKNVNSAITALKTFHESLARIQYVSDGRKEGVRLLPREVIPEYIEGMTRAKATLAATLSELQEKRDLVLEDAKIRLKDKFDAAAYPDTFVGTIDFSWDWPNLDPPNYLAEIAPEAYEKAVQDRLARFNETLSGHEEEYLSALMEYMEWMVSRTEYVKKGQREKDPKTGKEKEVKRNAACGRVFHEKSIENILDFLGGFKLLRNIVPFPGKVLELVNEAEEAVKDRRGNIYRPGTLTQHMKTDSGYRAELHEKFSTIKEGLSEFLVDRPRRRLAK